MGLVDARQDELLQHYFGDRQVPAKIATYHFALSTTTPNSDGSNFEEPTPPNGYARVQVTNDFNLFTTAGAGTLANTRSVRNIPQIQFPVATGNWTQVTHWGMYDAGPTGGNLICYGPLATPRTVQSGEQWAFEANDIEIYQEQVP